MSDTTRILAGILLLSLVTVETGGIYLVKLAQGAASATPFQIAFARAGHAHAGVFVILSLICQILADSAALPLALIWMVRLGVPAAAIFVPLGFFLSIPSPDATAPNRAVSLIYVGAASLALSVLTLGVGLLRGA